MMITYDDTNDIQKYVDNVLIADVWLNLAVTTVTSHSPGILVNKLVGIYFKGKITKKIVQGVLKKWCSVSFANIAATKYQIFK